MKCSENWSFDCYLPPDRKDSLFIWQIIPHKDSIELSWYGSEKENIVSFRLKGSTDSYKTIKTELSSVLIKDLEENKDYEFLVESSKGRSRIGYARTGYVPGTVVNYLHPDDTKYAFSGRHLCTPSILVHPAGYLLASMDVFEGAAPQNLTLIFRSDDNGKSWYHLTELFPCFWGTLFYHRGDVYMLSTSTEYGDLLMGRSSDGGKTWGRPTVLARGSCNVATPGWHKSSMPVIEHKGRLWCGVDFGSHRAGGHRTCLVSADANADLTDAESWSISEPLKFSSSWKGAAKWDERGFIEGNAVVLPDGEIGNMLRYMHDLGEPSYGLAGVLRGNCEDPDAPLKPYKFVKFPGNLSKFDVKQDPVSGMYFAIMSRIKDGGWIKMRNLLSLAYSKDLETWHVLEDLIDGTDYDPKNVGFQYVSFCFDGDDIVYLSRTAFNGAQNYHDNNYVTFHRVKNFRVFLT